jgi:hypothetical protein
MILCTRLDYDNRVLLSGQRQLGRESVFVVVFRRAVGGKEIDDDDDELRVNK